MSSVKITVTGDLGSGKSTTCGALNRKFGLQIFSTGSIQRKIAVEMGMSTLELNKYMETHPEIDRLIDGELVKLSASPDNIAIDSRMAWHFVEDTFNVFLTTDETVAAQRILADKRGPSEGYTDVPHAIEMLRARKKSENYRYKEKYSVECYDYSNYDLILDTTGITPEYTADVIMDQFSRRASGSSVPVYLISPFCLYPTREAGDVSSPAVGEYCEMILGGQRVEPVKIIMSNGFFYIYEGHDCVKAYCKLKKPHVLCVVAAQDDEEVIAGLTADMYVKKEFDSAKALKWEEANDVKFLTYPGLP